MPHKKRSVRVSSTFSPTTVGDIDYLSRMVGVSRTTMVTSIVIQYLLNARDEGRIPSYIPRIIEDMEKMRRFILYFLQDEDDLNYDPETKTEKPKAKVPDQIPEDISTSENGYIVSFLDLEEPLGTIILTKEDVIEVAAIIGVDSDALWDAFFEAEEDGNGDSEQAVEG